MTEFVRRLAVAAFLAAILPAGAARAEQTQLVAVLRIDASPDVDDRARDSLEETLRTVAGDVLQPYQYVVLTGQTTYSLLKENGVDLNKVCESSCILEAAREIKAALFLSGSLSRVEGDYVAFIRLYDQTGKQLGSARLEGTQMKELRAELERKAPSLFGIVLRREGATAATATPEPKPVEQPHPTPVATPVVAPPAVEPVPDAAAWARRTRGNLVLEVAALGRYTTSALGTRSTLTAGGGAMARFGGLHLLSASEGWTGPLHWGFTYGGAVLGGMAWYDSSDSAGGAGDSGGTYFLGAAPYAGVVAAIGGPDASGHKLQGVVIALEYEPLFYFAPDVRPVPVAFALSVTGLSLRPLFMPIADSTWKASLIFAAPVAGASSGWYLSVGAAWL